MKNTDKEKESLDLQAQSRRSFLKGGAAGAALLAISRADAAVSAVGAKKKRFAMVIDLQRCTGCGSCIVTCKNENNVQLGTAWSSKINRTTGTFPNVRYEYIPTLCNQCCNAPCVKSCPTGAMYKGEGEITRHEPKKCIGCKTCKATCPYEVIHVNKRTPHKFWKDGSVLIQDVTASAQDLVKQVNSEAIPYFNPAKENMAEGGGLRYKGIVEKCTFCDHRVLKGLRPYCVEGCPANARIFGDLNDPKSDVSRLLARYSPWRLKEKLGTEPKVYYIRNFNSPVNRAGKGSA